MKIRRLIFSSVFLISLMGILSGKNYVHRSGFPYIAGDTFRDFCDHKIDHEQSVFRNVSVHIGDTIFVKTDYLEWFFKVIHPTITVPYVLITHNSAYEVPRNFKKYLEDNTLIAWFGQNCRTDLHPKLFHLPLGLANSYWKHGDVKIVKQVQELDHAKKYLLYMNFALETNKAIRTNVYNLFCNESYCHCSPTKEYEEYLTDLVHSKFVLSPPGRGEDCVRTWEALYMGAIPIVQTSFLDPMFEGLPVVIVDDWSKINEEFLEKKYEEMSRKEYDLDRLYAPYWFTKIEEKQKEIRKKNSAINVSVPKMVIGRELSKPEYGTHMAPLLTAVSRTSGPVLELGCGDYSTTLLHALCSVNNRLLVTAETDEKWMNLFLDLERSWHQFIYVPVYANSQVRAHLWDDIGNDIHWSVVFIDHRPGERRKVDIARFKNNADIIVVHDTEAKSYKYEPVLSQFRYRYDYTRYKVRTTLVSDVIDIGTLFE